MPFNRRLFLSLAVAGVAAFGVAAAGLGTAHAASKRICVSWRHFQEERWRIDEAGIKSVLDPAGYTYVSADAQADPQKQLTDVENLIAGGCDALIVLRAGLQGHPAGDRPRQGRRRSRSSPMTRRSTSPMRLFVSFDNVAVGHLMAEAMVKVKTDGNWVLIEGDASHPIVNDLPRRPDGSAASR